MHCMRMGTDAEYKERNRCRVIGEVQMQSIRRGTDAEYKEWSRCRI